jgi:hypothetical protein
MTEEAVGKEHVLLIMLEETIILGSYKEEESQRLLSGGGRTKTSEDNKSGCATYYRTSLGYATVCRNREERAYLVGV